MALFLVLSLGTLENMTSSKEKFLLFQTQSVGFKTQTAEFHLQSFWLSGLEWKLGLGSLRNSSVVRCCGPSCLRSSVIGRPWASNCLSGFSFLIWKTWGEFNPLWIFFPPIKEQWRSSLKSILFSCIITQCNCGFFPCGHLMGLTLTWGLNGKRLFIGKIQCSFLGICRKYPSWENASSLSFTLCFLESRGAWKF